MDQIGVLIVGINGAVASTVVAGVELMIRGRVPRIGMITEPTDAKIAEPLTSLLSFVPLENLVFAGWDMRFSNVYEGALQHGVLPHDLLTSVRGQLESVQQWPAISFSSGAHNRRGAVQAGGSRAQIEALIGDIESFRRDRRIDRLVMVNLASTEPFAEKSVAHESLAAFERALDRNDATITPAMLYFHVANKLSIPYCNFTPSLTNVPALAEQSERTRNPYAGMDGKTGQTLVKTALAPMMRVRRLRINGWYSTNILGNNDGLVLDSPGPNKTKVASKTSVLEPIVGYRVENHQVHIHYYKPRGDAKESWDSIDIAGFAGVTMQLKINFLCHDSALAAPLVIDLVRLLDVAKRVGEWGIQKQLSLFFKSPYYEEGETPVHDLFEQEALLLRWAREKSAASRVYGVKARAPVSDQ
jgi:myo-inositol-1-phosphate synthase